MIKTALSFLTFFVAVLNSFASTVFVKVNTEGINDTAYVITERALSKVDFHQAIYVGKGSKLAAALPFDISMNAKVKYGKLTFPLYISSGDSLWIDFVSGKPNFTGKKANENAVLLAFTQMFSGYYQKDSLRRKIYGNSIDEFEIALFDQRKIQQDWIEKQDVSAEFKSFLNQYVRFWYWGSIFGFPIERANASPQNPIIPLPKLVLEGFDASSINSPQLLVIESFKDFLTYYITYVTSESNGFTKFTDIGTSTERKSAQIYSRLKGEVAVFIASKFFVENIQKLSEPVGKRLLSTIEEKDASKMYFKYLQPEFKTALENASSQTKNSKELAVKDKSSNSPYTLKDLKGKTIKLEDFKGKVVYVDFWASWCGPCRQMFPFSKQLHEKLSEKQKKEIVFLYISIDGAEDSWKKGVEQLGLDNGINVISPGNWQSEVVKYFQISSIPRYMIFDKKGNLVDSNAKRPADPSLLSDLLKLLE
jgi:thiol-disulfide isomerase/thioredoxin